MATRLPAGHGPPNQGDAMSFDLPLRKSLIVNLMGPGSELSGQLIDREDGTWLLRAPEVFAVGEVPDFIELSFGHKNFFWRVPVEVKAGYAPWLFLKPPDEDDARKFQRRSFVRIALSTRMVAIPVTPNGTQRGAPVPLEVLNLSAGGCLARADGPLGAAGEHLVIAVNLPGVPTVPTPSRVVRSQDGVYGIQFSGLTGTPRDGVAKFVTDQIAHNLQRGKDITLPEPSAPAPPA
jgi:hypothetical protein